MLFPRIRELAFLAGVLCQGPCHGHYARVKSDKYHFYHTSGGFSGYFFSIVLSEYCVLPFIYYS